MHEVLCPYCQLQSGSVSRDSDGLVCLCPDCGEVALCAQELTAWRLDHEWLIRRLRQAFEVPASQAAVTIVENIWRIGTYQQRPLVLVRRLDALIRQPMLWSRVQVRKEGRPWVISPKPLSDFGEAPLGDRGDWLPLEERVYLRGGNLHLIEPGEPPLEAEEVMCAVNGPFSEDFRWMFIESWPHGPIALSPAQAAVFKTLWRFRATEQEGHVIMAQAGLKSDRPGDVFKVKAENKGDPAYEGPAYAFKTRVKVNRRAGTYLLSV